MCRGSATGHSAECCWSAFDGAISVGYNTAGELLHHGVPTIWIPFEKRLDDQQLRAQRAVERGAGWLVLQNDTAALRAALGRPATRETGRCARCGRQMVPMNERSGRRNRSWSGWRCIRPIIDLWRGRGWA